MIKKILVLMVAFSSVFPVFANEHAGRFFRLELLHVEGESEPTDVKLRIPVGMIAAWRPAMENAVVEMDEDINFQLFRDTWASIREAGPFQMLEINNEDLTLTASSTETDILIKGNNEDMGDFTIRVPHAVGDLIFNTDHEIHLDEMLSRLTELEGDLVTISSDQLEVRAWIE